MHPRKSEALGLCLGASSIGMVRLVRSGETYRVVLGLSRPHGGNPSKVLLDLLASIPAWHELPMAATGRKLRDLVRLASLSEPEAVELATAFVLGAGKSATTVLSAGGETFMAYHLDASGQIRDIQSGNKCASGTGEFLLQQLGRMGLGVNDLRGMDCDVDPYTVSGRCSVFCKSDCTHALNKGAQKQAVVAGLGRMMAGKCLELIHCMPRDRVLLTGGCAANPYLVRFLKEHVGKLIVPDAAPWFEALGAALWAMEHAAPPPASLSLLAAKTNSFVLLPPLSDYLGMVDFKDHLRGKAHPGDEVLIGLDVGSTTTKGVLIRRSDKAVLAGEYLRTEGDPVDASRQVYLSLARQLGVPVRITGLGVTGSGRAIAALHGSATAAINEIVAHAAAAAHYDPNVDTIFEIGGQDAKYTYLCQGHPCDSAMNEACSAGTGSFLEESARESLGVDTLEIAELALAAASTPNFNDQCAAFIGSDIKRASQEGLSLPDILAGLVHSICLNYVSRVKGNRPTGERVFMQGGVCYNKAVPAAMAMLTGRRIVVPPEPGLMGALGVALVVDRRMRRGILTEGKFDLPELARRQATQRAPFSCRGGKGGQPGCDLGCTIARVEIEGKVHPFGGICNRFENLRKGTSLDVSTLDFVQARQRRIFCDHAQPKPGRPTVGLSRSYLVNTYYPFFSTFFRELGFEVVLPDRPDPAGIKRGSSALCYPAELSLGFMADLLTKRPDVVFLPHVRGLPSAGGQETSCTCVLLQGEPFYLKSAFPELAALGPQLLHPTLDFTGGLAMAQDAFMTIARGLGAGAKDGLRAFQAGLCAQRLCRDDLAKLGVQALSQLGDSPDRLGVVLFGRSYNAFAPDANKGVPGKLATRGALVIPCDILPLGNTPDNFSMYWAQGRTIMAASRFTAANPKLFATYVTNFSCGPDSFLLGYFRDEMGSKPSLTLELDSHTADAGLETRIEAFLDIARNHLRLGDTAVKPGEKTCGHSRIVIRNGQTGITASSGEWLPFSHERVCLALPSMNPYGTALAASALASSGIRAVGLPPAGESALKLGRANSTCKECLPLQLTVGTLLEYLAKREPNETTAYFMPGANGPCRFGQYHEYTSRLISKLNIPDVAVLSARADNGYAGLSNAVTLGIWRGTVLGDIFEEIRSTLLAAAKDPLDALAELDRVFDKVNAAMRLPWKKALKVIREQSGVLSNIPLLAALCEIPQVALLGEIYVRHDPISRQRLVERLAAKGIAVRTSPVSEWIFYTDWLQNSGLTHKPDLMTRIKQWVKRRCYHQARSAFMPSGLLSPHPAEIKDVVQAGSSFVSPGLTGEAILTVGAAFHEILNPACGIIAIGPFGCMPTRLAEAILAKDFRTDTLARLYPERVRRFIPDAHGKLPFLTVETDGNPFPQLIEARIEAFCLQAVRLHTAMCG
ncbi:MAG: activase [Desulfovibrio sp.]|nr:activase [Desulfovibrio sp.]MBI4959348.1 activase [Desulfovibrio sp.]